MKRPLALAFFTIVVAAACAGGNDHVGANGLGGGGSASTGAPKGGGGSGGGIHPGSGGSGGDCPATCSADLHQILDCHGDVVETCSGGKGCGKKGCVDACEAAQDNQSSIGCDFYVVDPDSDVPGSCFAAFVANTWTRPITITLEDGGHDIDLSKAAVIAHGSGPSLTYEPLPNGKLPVGEVGIVFLAFAKGGLPCPDGVTAAIAGDPATHGTGYGQALHLSTDAPVSAYDIFPYGGGQAAVTSATLLLPTSAWDTNYVAVDAFSYSVAAQLSPTLTLVASQDDTKVTLNPTAQIVGSLTVPAAFAHRPVSYHLGRGQVLQFAQSAELVGSAIESDKPIGVWGGHQCLNIAPDVKFCDSAHQQIPPVKALGSEYVAVRYRNRYDGIEESPPWRFVGAVDGTKLSYEPAAPPNAPASLEAGQVALFEAPGPFVVKSQDADHPFYFSAHMTSCATLDTTEELTDCRGDPEFVNVLPPGQFLQSYVFFTDPTYPETNLVLVRQKVDGAFADVKLDCAGTLDGWEPIGGSPYEFTRVDLTTGNFQGQNGCDNGRHEITSQNAFGITVWGWGSAATGQGDVGGGAPDGVYTQAVSYAYPAGASVHPINTVRVPTAPK